MASTNESSANWAYFAKKEYLPPQSGGGWGARVLYAWGNALQLEGVTVSPTSVHGGNNATGTVLLNGPAGPGGVNVTVVSSNPAKAIVSTCVVTISEGSVSANFTITTSTVTSNTVVTISATATVGGIPKTVTCTLTVTP